MRGTVHAAPTSSCIWKDGDRGGRRRGAGARAVGRVRPRRRGRHARAARRRHRMAAAGRQVLRGPAEVAAYLRQRRGDHVRGGARLRDRRRPRDRPRQPAPLPRRRLRRHAAHLGLPLPQRPPGAAWRATSRATRRGRAGGPAPHRIGSMADDLLRSVAAETVGVVGDAFLQRLVGAIGAALRADACWITEIEREHRVASWPPSGEVQPLDGRLSIDCPGTDGRPLARLVVAARSRPDDDELDALVVFATRVGAELERRTHESRLRERENEIVVSRARVLSGRRRGAPADRAQPARRRAAAARRPQPVPRRRQPQARARRAGGGREADRARARAGRRGRGRAARPRPRPAPGRAWSAGSRSRSTRWRCSPRCRWRSPGCPTAGCPT